MMIDNDLSMFESGILELKDLKLTFTSLKEEMNFKLAIYLVYCVEIIHLTENDLHSFIQIGYSLRHVDSEVNFIFLRANSQDSINFKNAFEVCLASSVVFAKDTSYEGEILKKIGKLDVHEYYKLLISFGLKDEIKIKLQLWKSGNESEILNYDQAIKLSKRFPQNIKNYTWKRLYKFSDGISLDSLYKASSLQTPTLLLLKTTNSETFGYFATEAWEPCKDRQYYGTGESFIFKVNDKDEVKVYKWSKKNSLFMCSTSSFIGIGSGGDGFAICLDENLEKGTTNHCETYNNPQLCSSQSFTLSNLELYCFQIPMHKDKANFKRENSFFKNKKY